MLAGFDTHNSCAYDLSRNHLSPINLIAHDFSRFYQRVFITDMISTPAVPVEPARAAETGNADSGDDTVPDIILREPEVCDGPRLHELVSQCPPLDLNSLYSYLLLCEHHASTCVVAEVDGQVCGFVSAYLRPDQPDVLFVWQVAVHEKARGMGLARRMLRALLERESTRTARYLETTVGPENQASRRMFAAVAAHYGATTQESLLFGADLFGAGEHEDECLLRIGPIHSYKTTKENSHEIGS